MHPSSAMLAVFFISLSESLAIVGLLVPGVVLMTAIGSMMGAGILPFYQTLLWAILGAIAGDGISYWLGYHYHQRLRHFWPFRQFPRLLARGEAFFSNHGGKSIVFGRFVGPVRPMIPVIAGMMDMTPKRFLFFNILSAIVWAPLYSLPGILIGMSLGNLSAEVASRAGLLVIILLLALWCIYEFLVLLGSWLSKSLAACVDRLWQSVFSRLPLISMLCRTQQGSSQGQFGILVLLVFSLGSFLSISHQVLEETGITVWNEPIYHLLRALYSDQMIQKVLIFTSIGSPLILGPAAGLMGLWLFYKGRGKAAFCWLFTTTIGFGLGYWLKIATAIQRPDGLLALSDQYSFPSNHALCTLLVFGLAATYLRDAIPRSFRWIPITIALLLSFSIGLSRLYLEVHWFSDVLGGLLLGLALVSAGTLLFRAIDKQSIPLQTLIPGLLGLVLALGVDHVLKDPHLKNSMIRLWPTDHLSRTLWWQGKGPTQDLYRSGAIKKQATRFDVQWIGTMKEVETPLLRAGWVPLPTFNFKTGVMLLANHPNPRLFPVMPKFHHDRLPVLRMTKVLEDDKRIVLQLWASDYFEGEKPLWVGTLRLEEASHPLPLVTLYLENSDASLIQPEQLTRDLHAHRHLHLRMIRSKILQGHRTLLIYSEH
jgi:membrane protein DedA with SNARE-associated domain